MSGPAVTRATASVELAAAESTASFSTTSATPVDATGMSATFVAPANGKAKVIWDARFAQNSASGAGLIVQIVRTDTSAVIADLNVGYVTGTPTLPAHREARMTGLTPGTSYTVKLQLQAVTGGTAQIGASATSKNLLQVVAI